MKKTILSTVIFLILLFTACQKDEQLQSENIAKTNVNARISDDNIRVGNTLNEFSGQLISATVLVEVVDENGNPASGVNVQSGESSIITNEDGLALFPELKTNENFAYVTAEKAGYFHASRAFIPNESGSQVKIQLIAMHNPQPLNAEQGGEIYIETPYGQSVINFSDGFVDENGLNYNGMVKVYTSYLNPLAQETGLTMPGSLLGVTTLNEIVVLGTYGMFNVELRGEQGQELQIVNSAKIRTPIHPDQLANAPDTIPMWYFNEQIGMWIEEGFAVKSGNEYITTVNHFTCWNYDISMPRAHLTVYVSDQYGNPVPNAFDHLWCPLYNSYGFTNGNGVSSGWVPANESLTYTATKVSCSTSSNSLGINPISVNSSSTKYLSLNVVNPNNYVLTGQLTDCNGPVVSPNGFVLVTTPFGPVLAPVNATGNYSVTIPSCSRPTVTVTGFNRMLLPSSTPITLTLNSGTTIQNVDLCGEYIQYSIDGAPMQTDDVNPGGGFNLLGGFEIEATNAVSGNSTKITSQTQLLGGPYNYGTNPNELEFTRFSDPNGVDSAGNGIQFTITNISMIGRPIEIIFSGNYFDLNGVPHTILGRAKIIRDF